MSWDSAWPCLSCTSLARPLPLVFAHRGERCRARPGIETIVDSPVFTGFQKFSLSNGHVLGFWLTFSKLSPRPCGGQAGELRGTELRWAGEGGRVKRPRAAHCSLPVRPAVSASSLRAGPPVCFALLKLSFFFCINSYSFPNSSDKCWCFVTFCYLLMFWGKLQDLVTNQMHSRKNRTFLCS